MDKVEKGIEGCEYLRNGKKMKGIFEYQIGF